MTESFEAPPPQGDAATLGKVVMMAAATSSVRFQEKKKIKSAQFGSILSSSFHPVSYLLYLWQLPVSLHRLPEARKSDLTAPTAAAKTAYSQPVNMALHM